MLLLCVSVDIARCVLMKIEFFVGSWVLVNWVGLAVAAILDFPLPDWKSVGLDADIQDQPS